MNNIPLIFIPILLLEAVFYFLPLWPKFSEWFRKLYRPMQAGLIWVSGVAPMLLLHWAQAKTPDEFPLFAVALGIVCVWYLVLPKKPMADILLLGLLAAFILLPWFKDMFPSPPGSTKLGFLNKQLWLRVGIGIFLYLRGMKVPGFGLMPTSQDWWVGTRQFLYFLAILLPVGFYFNILRIQFPKLSTWVIPFAAVGTFVGVYLFLALLEEFMFRGVLQQVLIQGLGSKWTGLILASLCFGAVHLPFREFPNWRFALLSTVAGVFYGLAYEKANSLRAAMITHSLVVTLWTIVFSRSL